MIYVYAITDVFSLPDSVPEGIGARPVILHVQDRLGAVCSQHDQRTIKANLENVQAHERVVEACMEIATVLPARFGTCFKDEQLLGTVLKENAESLREGLVRVRGCVEMGMRVLWPTDKSDGSLPESPASATGKEYLLHRAAFERARLEMKSNAERAASALHSEFSRDALAGTLDVISAGEAQLRGAYLVRRDRMEAFQDHVREISQLHPHLRILGTGPWPPYHFTPALRLQPAEVCHA